MTSNLLLALLELRQQGIQVVGADAICINQSDFQERSQQVLLMSRIYQQAEMVVVHLGHGCKCHKRSVFTLMRISTLAQKVLKAVRPEHDYLDPSELSANGIPPLTHSSWQA